MFVVALMIEFSLFEFLGMPPELLLWIISGQVVLGCIMVAALDHTFGLGYIFSLIMAIVLLVSPFPFRKIWFMAVACMIATYATYQARRWLGRWRSTRRLTALRPTKTY